MKKLLVVTYNFYEDTMAAARMRRIVYRMRTHGYDPVILTHPPLQATQEVRALDHEMLHAEVRDLGQLWKRFRVSGNRQREAANGKPSTPVSRNITLTSFINRWFMIPDKQIVWRRPALKKAREYLRNSRADVIYASLEPRTMLLIAAQLAREFRVPCVMEYRDLWTGSPYYSLAQPTALHRWIHARLECRAIAKADRVTALSMGIGQYLGSKYGRVLGAPVEINYNFYDPNEYSGTAEIISPARPFVIAYAGAMYFSRSPQAFLRGLRLFIDSEKLSPEDVRFRWIGSVFGMKDLDALVDELQLQKYIDFAGQVSHEAALRMLAESSCALILQAPDDRIHIPGKLFEAMGARVPVLTLTNPCEVADIISRTGAGITCRHDPREVASALKALWLRIRNGETWAFNEIEIRRFSAEWAVEKLAALFDGVHESQKTS